MMKKLLAIVLCGVLLITSVGYVHATEAQGDEAVYSDASYGGFDLSWTNYGERDILLAASNDEGVISFQYDDRELRTSKTSPDGEVTYFTYD